MGRLRRSDIEERIEALNVSIGKFLESEKADSTLIKANADLLREKEDLETKLEIHSKQNYNLRRELKKANDDLAEMREMLTKAEADIKPYKESIGKIQELKDNLESGILKLSIPLKRSI